MPGVADIIRDAAMRYGVSPDYMLRAAQIESRLNPNAANPTSSARGLFQFMTRPGGSWSTYGRGGNPLDPVASSDAGARYTLDNQRILQSTLKREPTPGELYLAHQQGAAGAAALLADPNRPAIDAIAKFYRDPQTAVKAIVLNGGTPGMSSGEFASKWTSKFDGGAAPLPAGTPPGTATATAAQVPAPGMLPPGAALGSLFADALAPLVPKPEELTTPQKRPSLATILGQDDPRLVLSG